MKKFFKALALVLALTLVVGVVPATAARAEVMKSKTLYLDGAKGTSEDGKACSVKAKKAIYKLAGYTKDTKEGHEFKAVAQKDGIVTITKSYVKAAALGSVDVDIYDGDVKIGTTTVKVKKNATPDSLVLKVDDGDVPEKLIAGATYTFKLPRVGQDSDERRIWVNGTQLTDIKDKARQYEYTCTEDDAKAGKITVKYESFQSKTYNAATQTKTVEIPVGLGTMEKVSQTVYNAFKLTFANEGTAKAAVDATKPSLNTGSAAVTENTEIVKVFQVLDNGEEIAAFIGSIAVDSVNKSVVNVTMFADLAEKAKYKVVYGDVSLTFVAADWTPESIKGYEATYTPIDDGESKGGTATLAVKIYSIGDQGQNVDITDKALDLGTVTFSDPNAAKNDYSKYSLNGELVDFYVNDLKIDAHVDFTYFGGTTAVDYKDDFTVSSSDDRHFTILYYNMDDETDTPYDVGTKREAFISADDNTMRLDLRMKSEIVIDGNTVLLSDSIYGNNENVRFVTSNTDKLAIQEKDTNRGFAYAPKAANATVAVWVYYGEKICDADASVEGIQPIYVNVYDHKMLGTATVTDTSDGRIGYSNSVAIGTTKFAAVPYTDDCENWKITATDVQGRPYEDVTVTVKKLTNVLDTEACVKVDGASYAAATLLAEGGTIEKQMADFDNDWGTFGTKFIKFWAQPAAAVNSAKTVGYEITIQDNNSTKKIVTRISFKVKNTNASEVTKQIVESASGYKVRVIGQDAGSYPVCIYTLANAAGTVDTLTDFKNSADTTHLYVGFFKGADGSEMGHNVLTATNQVQLITEVAALRGGLTKLTTQTLGAIAGDDEATTGAVLAAVTPSAVTAYKHIDSGAYAARAYYYKSGKVVSVGSNTLQYAPVSYYNLSWTWKTAYTEETVVKDVLDDALRFTIYFYDQWGNWKGEYKNVTLSTLQAAGVPIEVSYTKKDDSLTVLYAYINEAALYDGTLAPLGVYTSYNPLYVETKIARTIYTGVEK